jgi:hypothetical protein
MLVAPLCCTTRMPLARHVVLLLYTLTFGMELLNILRTQIEPQCVHFSHLSASQRNVASIFWPLLNLQHTFKPQTIPQHTCLKLTHSIRSVLTSICSICVSNLYTVYDKCSPRSVVYVTRTCKQYMISSHIDLQYMWLRPIDSTWSVRTSICSICDSNLYTVYDQYSHRSAVYVTQTYTQYMISTHIDLQFMRLKSIRSIWSVLTSICCIWASNRCAVYDQYSHRSVVYVAHIDTQYMTVFTSICSIRESSRYTVRDQYSPRPAVYVTQIDMHCMFKVHIDLQCVYIWLQTDPQCMSSPHTDSQCPVCWDLSPICGVCSA